MALYCRKPTGSLTPSDKVRVGPAQRGFVPQAD